MTVKTDVPCHIHSDIQKNGHVSKCRVKKIEKIVQSFTVDGDPSLIKIILRSDEIIRQTNKHVIDVIYGYLLIELTQSLEKQMCNKSYYIS